VPVDRTDDELRDDEWPDPADLEHDDEPDTTTCPECGRTIHEDAPRCPHCGVWLTEGSAAAVRSRGWLWPSVVGTLVLLGLLGWRILR